VDEWLAAGIETPWSEGFVLPDGKFKNTGEVHYRGAGGTRMIANHVARNLDVRSQIEVTRISIEKGLWRLQDASGNVYTGKALTLTPVLANNSIRHVELTGSPKRSRLFRALQESHGLRLISAMDSRSVLRANAKGAVSPAGGTLKTAEELLHSYLSIMRLKYPIFRALPSYEIRVYTWGVKSR
jgi:hypothetical protein